MGTRTLTKCFYKDYTDSERAHENVFTIADYQENENASHMLKE